MYYSLFISFFCSLFILIFKILVVKATMVRERSNSQSSVKSTASQKRPIDLNKIDVYLEYPCFICGLVLGSARRSIEHVRKIHNYEIPFRPKDQVKRPRHHRFFYVREKNGKFTITENACPSCWFHCPLQELEVLNEHVRDSHSPRNLKRKEEEVDQQSKPSEDVVDDKDNKHVKFERGNSQNSSDSNPISKIAETDATVMQELVKAFEIFAQSMKSFTKSKEQ